MDDDELDRITAATQHKTIAGAFADLQDAWRQFLLDAANASGLMRLVDWLESKLQRWFP